MPERKTELTRDEILLGLEKVNAFLEKADVRGEICVYGGACLCLAFAARNSTKDVDAVFKPADVIRKAAMEVAAELEWDWNWLNDDVAGFLSADNDADGLDRLECPEFSHLKVFTASAAYLLAMKCFAARLGDEEEPSLDLKDAIFLCKELGLTEREEIVQTILKFFPDRIPPERTDFFIEEVVERLAE